MSDLAATRGAGGRPLVSFCVLGYNQEAYIREAIEGAFAQTYEPLEIVLSDDASGDRTYPIMQAMAAAYEGPHRVIVSRNEPNRGIVGNVNRLMDLSQGALIVKNDGDDVSEPHRARRLVEAWEASGRRLKAIGSGALRIDEEGREIGRLGVPRIMRVERSPLAILRDNLYALGATSAWTRDLWERFGPIDARAVVEDTVIPFRAALLGEIGHVDEPLVRYRVGGISALARERSFGWNMMYGQRLKLIRLHMGTKRAILADLEGIDFPERDACVRHCEDFIAKRAFQLRIAEGRKPQHLAALAPAMGRSLRERDPFYAYMALKYLLDGPAILAYNLKNLRARRSLS